MREFLIWDSLNLDVNLAGNEDVVAKKQILDNCIMVECMIPMLGFFFFLMYKKLF